MRYFLVKDQKCDPKHLISFLKSQKYVKMLKIRGPSAAGYGA